MTAVYWLVAGATMERVGSHLRASSWPAPLWVTYVAAALAGVLWPLALAFLAVARAREGLRHG